MLFEMWIAPPPDVLVRKSNDRLVHARQVAVSQQIPRVLDERLGNVLEEFLGRRHQFVSVFHTSNATTTFSVNATVTMLSTVTPFGSSRS